MKAQTIDPRDQTSFVSDPSYRVFFWTDDGSRCEEWELTEADLGEVLAWIPSKAGGRSHSLWVVVRTPGDVCLVRLEGVDLDAGAESWPIWAHRLYR